MCSQSRVEPSEGHIWKLLRFVFFCQDGSVKRISRPSDIKVQLHYMLIIIHLYSCQKAVCHLHIFSDISWRLQPLSRHSSLQSTQGQSNIKQGNSVLLLFFVLWGFYADHKLTLEAHTSASVLKCTTLLNQWKKLGIILSTIFISYNLIKCPSSQYIFADINVLLLDENVSFQYMYCSSL